MEATLPEQIANDMRRAILRGHMPPGTAIKERDNAAELGVSRTPMREAIRILAQEGLVTLRPARSPIVALPDPREATDQAMVLTALEQLSAELACARATAEDLDRIAAIHARMEAEFDSADPLDMFEVDMSFHTAIAEASLNRSLAETHRTYLARLWRARYLSAMQRRNRDRVVDHHGRILAGLRARDAAATLAAIHDHLGNLGADIKTVLDQEAAARDNGQRPNGDGQ